MNVDKLSPTEFMGRYGRPDWLDPDNTTAVFVGSDPELRSYLASGGFVPTYGMFPGSGEATEFARDTSDYLEMATSALKDTVGDPLNVADQLKETADGLDVTKKASSYVPSWIQRLGATLPMKGREHARLYALPDGNYAAEMHTDPGVLDYVGDPLSNGDLWGAMAGVWGAVRYHYIDSKIRRYKDKAMEWAGRLLSPKSEPEPAVRDLKLAEAA